MGDPGLKSEFVAMQQEEYFSDHRQQQRQPQIDDYKLSVALDIARVENQLQRATNPRYRQMLKKALEDLRCHHFP